MLGQPARPSEGPFLLFPPSTPQRLLCFSRHQSSAAGKDGGFPTYAMHSRYIESTFQWLFPYFQILKHILNIKLSEDLFTCFLRYKWQTCPTVSCKKSNFPNWAEYHWHYWSERFPVLFLFFIDFFYLVNVVNAEGRLPGQLPLNLFSEHHCRSVTWWRVPDLSSDNYNLPRKVSHIWYYHSQPY